MTLRLRLRATFELLECSKKELTPEVHLWLSQTVSKDLVKRPLSADQATTISIDEQLTLVPPRIDGPSQSHQELLQAANLNVDVWSTLTNKHGLSCLNQSGSVRIPVYELMSARGPHRVTITIPSWGGPSGQKDDNVENYKGTVTIAPGVSFEINGVQVPPPDPRTIKLYGEVEAYKKQVFQHYIGSCVALFRNMPATWPAASKINAYVYQCRSGLLPAAGFLGNVTGGTGPDYFENAARTVLGREGLSLEQFEWLRDERAPAMLGRVLTLAANLMAYVPDIVFLPTRADRRRFLRKALESFDLARTRNGGDCEDLALEIVLEAAELLLLPKASLSRPLSQMQALRSMYVVAMSLGGVSSAEINGDYGQLKQMGAHMWSMMVWRPLWNEWWRRGNGRPVDKPMALGSPPGGQYVLVLEGTGFLQPEAAKRDVAMEEQLQAVLEAASGKPCKGFRKYFFYKHGRRSRFYQTVQVVFTNEYLMEARSDPSVQRHVCFAVCKPGPRPTVGVEFERFVLGDPNEVILWSEPAISPEEAACLRDAMRDQHPMPPLVWPGKKTPAYPSTVYTTNDARGGLSVDYFAHPKLMSQERLQRVAAACRNSGGILVGVSCSLEVASTELSAYRLRFTCKSGTTAEQIREALKRSYLGAGQEEEEDEEEEEF